MTTYVDSSALLKRYVAEPDSEIAEQLLASDSTLVTCWITQVEVRRNLARLLDGNPLRAAQAQLATDLDSFAMVNVDEATAGAASAIAETLGVRSLDAIHLAAAQRLQIPQMAFLSFDLRQGQAARALGFIVRGC